MLVGSDLHMAGYTDERMQQMQRRMLDAVAAIPGVTAVGYADHLPLGLGGGDSFVYSDATTDFRPTNVAADAMNYHISPGYPEAAGTRLLAGRTLTLNDDSKAPKVALVNRQFAVKVFGSVDKAIGGHFKYWDGRRVEVVGVVEDGKYRTLTEDQQPAMFFSFLQQQSSGTWLLVRSSRDPEELSKALQQTIHALDPGLPFAVKTWNREMSSALFAARVATVALGVLGLLGAMLAVTGHLRHGFLYRQQAAARAGNSHGAGGATQAGAADGIGTCTRVAFRRLGCGIGAGHPGVQGAFVHRVPGGARTIRWSWVE